MHMAAGSPDLVRLLALPPALTLSLVVSLDGQLCGADGSSRSISGPEDLDWLRRLRAASDVVLVGRATAEAERYRPIVTRPEYLEARRRAGLQPDPELRIVTRQDAIEDVLGSVGPRVLLEAGVRLHRALAHRVQRVWVSHSPVIVGDVGASFDLGLQTFTLAERWSGDRFALSRFERLNPR